MVTGLKGKIETSPNFLDLLVTNTGYLLWCLCEFLKPSNIIIEQFRGCQGSRTPEPLGDPKVKMSPKGGKILNNLTVFCRNQSNSKIGPKSYIGNFVYVETRYFTLVEGIFRN